MAVGDTMKTLLGITVVTSLFALSLAARWLTPSTPCPSKTDDSPCSEAG
jgi:hypothetical protein